MNRQMSLDCMELIQKKMTVGLMTRDEYYLELIELHKKYPMPGHNPPLTKYQLSHYMELKEICTEEIHWKNDKGETGTTILKYEDHLQPMNFQEAAEMFALHWERIDKEKPPLSAWRKKVWPLMTSMNGRDKKLESTGEHEEVPF